MGRKRAGSQRFFKVAAGKIDGRNGPGSQPCQRRQRGQSARSLFIKGRNSGLLRSSTKGEKVHSHKRCPLFLALLETIPNPSRENGPSTTFCFVPSGETGQVVDESHKYQHKILPENLFVCKDQRPLSLARLAIWHHGNAGWGQSSYATGVGQAESNQPAQNPKKANFFSRLNNKMNGPMPRGPSRGIVQ